MRRVSSGVVVIAATGSKMGESTVERRGAKQPDSDCFDGNAKRQPNQRLKT